ncbi:hypothetical protein AB0H86_27255 [Streptomyces sp. NPDC050997]|uniref:hypothetical protein n=1 Tax=Streptomyces sp. NPDC050997 TaxID=3155519 RepID=UPI00341CA63C
MWRFVLWSGEGRRREDIAELAGVAPLTVDRCTVRHAERGLAGLEEKRRGGPRTQVPPQARARVIAGTFKISKDPAFAETQPGSRDTRYEDRYLPRREADT